MNEPYLVIWLLEVDWKIIVSLRATSRILPPHGYSVGKFDLQKNIYFTENGGVRFPSRNVEQICLLFSRLIRDTKYNQLR